MKENIQCAVVLAVCLALIPCLAFVRNTRTAPKELTVGIYMTSEGQLEEYTLDDYVTGAVLAQMPADFSEEALKAQAVLARTYIMRRYADELDSPTPSLHGGLISDDERIYQSFFTPQQAQDFYGENYDTARARVEKAVRAAPEILTYKDVPVTAAYHSASSGSTESALTAWGVDIPYLQAVPSESDAELDGIETKLTISADELRTCVKEQLGIDLTGQPEKQLETSANERGYVTEIRLCGTKVNVQQFIAAVGIASPCFTFEVTDSKFTFTARGFGHLVGLSQYGANSMAEAGSSCREILAHYFKGCKLKTPPQ
ncbi:SpoIID/LytB domain-containing protein [uncultured Ruminococcus sp.]|uniref:SpoIID/LytB domain-containing protein n=1 Tax=uncultured Ruminococcus sp. TaxID=165186 RepID=UPI000EBE1A30|nr:SpoIID/LytB domain-containing protein [uncultured Ruminococcus sp.]HCJ42070.1 stage II sporulation protein SpoIID [Ruminococcus sp.]